MRLTLGITGMDRATEAQLRTAFEQASPGLGGAWRLSNEAEAEYVVVDMDSMYGPMSWIRLHAAGKQVIALTTSARTQADHLLPQPVEAATLAQLLRSIGGAALASGDAPTPVHEAADAVPGHAEAAVAAEPPTPVSAREAAHRSEPEPAAAPEAPAPAVPPAPPAPAPAAPPSAATPAPAPADALPEERLQPVDEEAAAPPEPAAALEPAAPVAAPAPAGAAPGREPTLADWLAPGALSGRWRFARSTVDVVFDADARSYHGSATLKPLAPAFAGPVQREDLVPLDAAGWASASAQLGAAQPLSRLQWLGGLLAGQGALLPGLDPEGRFRLAKWPQTEREYPKHFRLATAMMKGPTTVADLAAASGVSVAEAADFINANLATGYAEAVVDTPPEPVEPARSGGLFGRIRGR